MCIWCVHSTFLNPKCTSPWRQAENMYKTLALEFLHSCISLQALSSSSPWIWQEKEVGSDRDQNSWPSRQVWSKKIPVKFRENEDANHIFITDSSTSASSPRSMWWTCSRPFILEFHDLRVPTWTSTALTAFLVWHPIGVICWFEAQLYVNRRRYLSSSPKVIRIFTTIRTSHVVSTSLESESSVSGAPVDCISISPATLARMFRPSALNVIQVNIVNGTFPISYPLQTTPRSTPDMLTFIRRCLGIIPPVSVGGRGWENSDVKTNVQIIHRTSKHNRTHEPVERSDTEEEEEVWRLNLKIKTSNFRRRTLVHKAKKFEVHFDLLLDFRCLLVWWSHAHFRDLQECKANLSWMEESWWP